MNDIALDYFRTDGVKPCVFLNIFGYKWFSLSFSYCAFCLKITYMCKMFSPIKILLRVKVCKYIY